MPTTTPAATEKHRRLRHRGRGTRGRAPRSRTPLARERAPRATSPPVKRGASRGRQQQRLERAPLTLAAHGVRAREEAEKGSDGDRNLQHEVDRLALLEVVECGVRRDKIGDQAEQNRERKVRRSAASAPEITELLTRTTTQPPPTNDRFRRLNQAASVIARKASLSRPPSTSKASTGTPASRRRGRPGDLRRRAEWSREGAPAIPAHPGRRGALHSHPARGGPAHRDPGAPPGAGRCARPRRAAPPPRPSRRRSAPAVRIRTRVQRLLDLGEQVGAEQHGRAVLTGDRRTSASICSWPAGSSPSVGSSRNTTWIGAAPGDSEPLPHAAAVRADQPAPAPPAQPRSSNLALRPGRPRALARTAARGSAGTPRRSAVRDTRRSRAAHRSGGGSPRAACRHAGDRERALRGSRIVVRIRIAVVLPAPFGPSTPRISPPPRRRSRSVRATSLRSACETPRSDRRAHPRSARR